MSPLINLEPAAIMSGVLEHSSLGDCNGAHLSRKGGTALDHIADCGYTWYARRLIHNAEVCSIVYDAKLQEHVLFRRRCFLMES